MNPEDHEAALCKIRLEENVRKLIRDEMMAAFQDYQFLNHVPWWGLADKIYGNNPGEQSSFMRAIMQRITNQLMRY